MTDAASLFTVQGEEDRRDIEKQVKELIGQGSRLTRRGLHLLCKVTDSLCDLTQPTAAMIERWCIPMLGIVPYLYEQIEASLMLLETGYVSGAQSCLRSALEASQLLNLVVVDEQAAIQFSKPPEENPFWGPGSASIAFKRLQKEYPESIAGGKWTSAIYQGLSAIAHPTAFISAQTLLSGEGKSAQTPLGPSHHPMVTAEVIDSIGTVLVIAIQALCFDRPSDAPPVSPDLATEVGEWMHQVYFYGRRMRKRQLEDMAKHPMLQQMLAVVPWESWGEEFRRLLGPILGKGES